MLTPYSLLPGMVPCSIPRFCRWPSSPPLLLSLLQLSSSFLIGTMWVTLFPTNIQISSYCTPIKNHWSFFFNDFSGHYQSDLYILGWEWQVRMVMFLIHAKTTSITWKCKVSIVVTHPRHCWFHSMKNRAWSFQRLLKQKILWVDMSGTRTPYLFSDAASCSYLFIHFNNLQVTHYNLLAYSKNVLSCFWGFT